MGKHKNKKPNNKVNGPIVDAEFVKKETGVSSQSEEMKGENEMTDMEKKIEEIMKKNEELEKELKELKAKKDDVKENFTKTKSESTQETGNNENGEKKNGFFNKIGQAIKDHPVVSALGAAALGAAGTYAVVQLVDNDDDDDEDDDEEEMIGISNV